jgi:TPR repeat protein
LAAASNSSRAEFYLGTVYWNAGIFSQALEWFEKAASHGYAPAAYLSDSIVVDEAGERSACVPTTDHPKTRH